MLESRPLLFAVSGPSGSGKKTFIDYTVNRFSGIVRVPTFTTRPIRNGEEHNIDYVYISVDEFMKNIEEGKIFEYTKTYDDYYYGSPSLFIETGKDENIICELDYKGMVRVKIASLRKVISFFIMPPSLELLKKRILSRQDEKNINSRMEKAVEQIKFAPYYDYVLVNDDLNTFKTDIDAVIRAEMIKRDGAKLILDKRHAIDNTLFNK